MTCLPESSLPTSYLLQCGSCSLDSSVACSPSTDSYSSPNGSGRPVSSWAHVPLVVFNSNVARLSSQLAFPAGLYFSPDQRGGTTSLAASSSPTSHLYQGSRCCLDSSAACGPSTDSNNSLSSRGCPVSSGVHGSLVFSISSVASLYSQLVSPAGLYVSSDWGGCLTQYLSSLLMFYQLGRCSPDSSVACGPPTTSVNSLNGRGSPVTFWAPGYSTVFTSCVPYWFSPWGCCSATAFQMSVVN